MNITDSFKVCNGCDQQFPRTRESWSADKRNSDGFQGQCRSCVNAMHEKSRRKKNILPQAKKLTYPCLTCDKAFYAPPCRRSRGMGKFCSHSCFQKMRDETVRERFWKKVTRGNSENCWPWIGTININGYGIFWFEDRRQPAHRIAYLLTHGFFPKGYEACHSCDVRYPVDDISYRACCNPMHIWPGTPKENTQDMLNKGRGKFPGAHGERHPAAKLTEAEVRQIRALAVDISVRQLSERFGVGKRNISHIIRRETWTHVSD